MNRRLLPLLALLGAALATARLAQAQSPPAGDPMAMHPMHDMRTMDPLDRMEGPLGISWMREGSGTSWQPDTTPMFSHMQRPGGWSLMEHYNVFVGYDAATGPRGNSRWFSTNWVMLMARHALLGASSPRGSC